MAIGVGLFRIADRIGHLLRPNDKKMVRRNISEHYDVSNDFFRLFLDPSMMYSSARWEGTDSLEQAQTNKNDSLCRLLQLKPTRRRLRRLKPLARTAKKHRLAPFNSSFRCTCTTSRMVKPCWPACQSSPAFAS
jgi:hypothetical protein